MSESNQFEQKQPDQEQAEPEQSVEAQQIQELLNEVEVLVKEYENQLSTIENFHERYWHNYNQQILCQRFEELKAEIAVETGASATTESIISFNYKFAKIYSMRSNAYCALKKYEQALEDADRALKLIPTYAQAYNDRADVYRELKDYSQAITNSNWAIELNPKLFLAFLNRGALYHLLSEYQLALEDFNQAISIKADDPALYKHRAATYTKLENYQKAFEDYNHIIELDAQDAEAYFGRAYYYASQGKYEQAVPDFDRAVQFGFNRFDMYYWRGVTYYNLKNYQQAAQDYSQAIELKPDYAEAYYNRAFVNLMLKQRKQARADLKRVREIRTDIPPTFIPRFSGFRQVSWQTIFSFILVYAIIVSFVNLAGLNTPIQLTASNLFNKAGNDSLAYWILGWPILVWGIIFRSGKLKPADVGLSRSKLKSGFLVTFFLWLIPELLVLLFNGGLGRQRIFWPGWATHNLIGTLSNFLFYVVPSVALTLVVFHGFLLPQLHLKFGGRGRLLNALTVSQTFFALSYLPSWLSRSPGNDLSYDLLTFFLIGMFLGMVYLRTNNLIFCIGVYTLLKEPLSLFVVLYNHDSWLILLVVFVICCWSLGTYNGIHHMIVDDLKYPDWTLSWVNFARKPRRSALILLGVATLLITVAVLEAGSKLRIAGPFFFLVLWIPALIQIVRLVIPIFLPNIEHERHKE